MDTARSEFTDKKNPVSEVSVCCGIVGVLIIFLVFSRPQAGARVGGCSHSSEGADQGQSSPGSCGRNRPPGRVQPLRGEYTSVCIGVVLIHMI